MHDHNHHHHTPAHTKAVHDHSMNHGSAQDFLHRFWIVSALIIPLLLLTDKAAEILGYAKLPYADLLGFAIATVIFGFSFVFFQHAAHEIRSKSYGMMTLVSLAVGAGYLFSAVSTFAPGLNTQFYLEISTLIWILLFGHFLEARSSVSAGNALDEVAKLLPKKAHKIVDGKQTEVEVVELQEGDTVLIKPGEKAPADGIVIKGSANVNESLISGESKPVAKSLDTKIVAGSVCLDGSLTVRLTRVGEGSTVGQIKKLVAQAGQTKPRSQKIADRAAGLLTFVALSVSLATLLVWTLVLGETFVFAITLAISVLVIACPHALGLAIPTVTTITTTLAVKNGFFIKDLSKIESIRKAGYVVFDKTGTLTRGEFGVTAVRSEKMTEEELLKIAASLEQDSSHIIGSSILNYAKKKGLELENISEFKNLAGRGVQAVIAGEQYFVGNARLMYTLKLKPQFSGETGSTVVYVATKTAVLGHILLDDAIKESSYQAVKALHAMDVKVAMLTGDNEAVAKSVAEKLGVDKYYAEVLPEEKYKHIKSLQSEGNIVIMVGDGVNDAPALTQADVGVAIGAGTDVAVEAGDVVLTKNDPADIARLIKLSEKVYSKMIQNLVWALGYNIVAIPAAAGLFAAWGFFLRPEIGALVMSLSTVVVVINALTLKKAEL